MTPDQIAAFVRHPVTWEEVASDAIAQVCDATGISEIVLLSADRSGPVSRARHAAMAICRERGMSLSEIGRVFNRDHTSVLHGLRRVQQWKEGK